MSGVVQEEEVDRIRFRHDPADARFLPLSSKRRFSGGQRKYLG